MLRSARVYRTLLCIATFAATQCQAYQIYADLIPNGHLVTYRGETWPGVGHIARNGDGQINCFGQDFMYFLHKWTSICHLDSDGDGKTNGEELGDPNCTWKYGHRVPPPISHPGICEPSHTLTCNRYNLPKPICDIPRAPTLPPNDSIEISANHTSNNRTQNVTRQPTVKHGKSVDVSMTVAISLSLCALLVILVALVICRHNKTFHFWRRNDVLHRDIL